MRKCKSPLSHTTSKVQQSAQGKVFCFQRETTPSACMQAKGLCGRTLATGHHQIFHGLLVWQKNPYPDQRCKMLTRGIHPPFPKHPSRPKGAAGWGGQVSWPQGHNTIQHNEQSPHLSFIEQLCQLPEKVLSVAKLRRGTFGLNFVFPFELC
jgi:hypothetical protein